MHFVATFELAAAANRMCSQIASPVAMCPAHGIEKGAHRVGQCVLWACGCNLVLVAVLPSQYGFHSSRTDVVRYFVTEAALYRVGTQDVEFTSSADKLADRK